MVGQFDLLAEGKRHTCRQDADPYTNARKFHKTKLCSVLGVFIGKQNEEKAQAIFIFQKKT